MVGLLSPLDRKLWRDLRRIWAQAMALALVVASGVALLVMALTTIEALEETTEAYYQRYDFAQVFAEVTRAPEALSHELAELPSVRALETRIKRSATLDIEGFEEPVTAVVVSLPSRGEPRLNRLALRAGRLPDPARSEEVVLSEPFAEAHGLTPGGRFEAILNGVKRELQVVGLALSPEFVYVIAPGGLMPDDARFGVVWMGRDALAAAFDMEEAFNEISLTLLRGSDAKAAVAALDRELARYGGIGAYERADQVSNWFLQNEIEQQGNMAGLLPGIFLAVAAFLTQMVLGRVIDSERSEIGLLKAFGYSNTAIAWHYCKLVLVITGAGILIGFLMGSVLGQYNTRLYADFYRFPFLLYQPGPQSYAIAALVSAACALGGAFLALRKAVTLPPAEAMRPPAPPSFRRTWLSGSRVARMLDEPSRMIARRIIRWPLRAFISAMGVAMASAVLFLAVQWLDSIDHLVQEFFFNAQHQDVTLALVEEQPERVRHDLAALPGALSVETLRSVDARISHGAVSRRQALIGIRPGARLSPAYDVEKGPIDPPPQGLLISSTLAGVLGAEPGDRLLVELLEGRRGSALLPVTATFESYVDTPVYMDLQALSRFLQESRQANLAHLTLDAARRQDFLAAVKETPRVSAVSFRSAMVSNFQETLGRTIFIFVAFFILFSCTLAFGVVYNAVRIALSERARELATLRVLGFTRLEIAYVLLGEVGILTVLSLPLGALIGVGLAWYLSEQFATELFRVPLVVKPATLGLAASVILATALASAALVKRQLDRLDLIAVLKTRE